jgi:hypothetical protein
MFRCIYSLTDQESSSGEHILQNSLGARWTSERIVSDNLQEQFGHTIDVALERALQPVRNLLGTEGGRGGPGPTLKKFTTSAGEVVHLDPGSKPKYAAPLITEKHSDDRIDLNIRVGNEDQLRWAFAKLKQKYPGAKLEYDDLRKSASVIEGPILGAVTHHLSLGGKDYFRGILKSCFNLIGATHQAIAVEPCFDAVREFIREGSGTETDFMHWVCTPPLQRLPSIGVADHCIAILSRCPRRRHYSTFWVHQAVIPFDFFLFGGVNTLRLSG